MNHILSYNQSEFANSLIVPKSDTNALRPGQNLLKGAAMKDESWLYHVGSVVQEDTLSEDEVIMWPGTIRNRWKTPLQNLKQ